MMSNEPCKQNRDAFSHQAPQALYVHVPFCRAKCRYCDFYSRPADPALAGQYVHALERELQLHASVLALPLRSIFLGGGTPTSLGAPLLRQLLAPLTPLADAATEFSVESNPGVFDPDIAGVLAQSGVNRLNFGVQSFDSAELSLLGRIHSAQQANQAFATARAAGFHNVGLDLIYGIPGQTLRSWQASLEQALALGPAHLSCYALSFEDGTPLGEQLRRGEIAPMDEALQEDCYDLAIDLAARAGLAHYEISNFASPGRQCQHNLTYWHNRTYLGLGPAAASYLWATRRTNALDLPAYIAALEADQPPPATEESLPQPGRMAETLMLGLRMIDGVDCKEFHERFGQNVLDAFPQSLPRYLTQNALVMNGDRLRLARWALFACDTILADIIAESQP